jgi:hypothetical protein
MPRGPLAPPNTVNGNGYVNGGTGGLFFGVGGMGGFGGAGAGRCTATEPIRRVTAVGGPAGQGGKGGLIGGVHGMEGSSTLPLSSPRYAGCTMSSNYLQP